LKCFKCKNSVLSDIGYKDQVTFEKPTITTQQTVTSLFPKNTTKVIKNSKDSFTGTGICLEFFKLYLLYFSAKWLLKQRGLFRPLALAHL
jgi:hypothetical protein